MRLPPLLGVIFLLAGMSGSAAADIIVWRDASGVSHYTNDVSNVPPEYQGEAMTVAKEWTRALPAAEPVFAVAPTAVSADAAATPPTRDAYEGAYRAGLRAAQQADPPGNVTNSTGTVVQNVEVQPQTAVVADQLVPVPVIVGEFQPRGPQRPDDRKKRVQDRFPPAERAPSIQGPAGPPPISER
jgi:hypothetical protein